MSNRIAQALAKLFDRHRIVFWNDAKQEHQVSGLACIASHGPGKHLALR